MIMSEVETICTLQRNMERLNAICDLLYLGLLNPLILFNEQS